MDGYTLVETLHVSAHTAVERWRRHSDGTSLIAKRPSANANKHEVSLKLRYELEVLQLVPRPSDNIVEVDSFHTLGGETILLLRDVGGIAVAKLAQDGQLTLREILHIGQQVASALVCVHQADIVHKDVNPNNIIYCAKTQRVQLIDFNIASKLAREAQVPRRSLTLEGTLAYMSPEQTGRMNRAVDYRSDLYSLGATLYHLLTGAVPFDQRDPSQLVHAIIAKMPVDVSERAASIPAVLKAMVVKLMEKDPQLRYQSAYGLQHDLARCLRELEDHGHITEFVPGSEDRREQLDVPQKLYGRSTAVGELESAYARAASGSTQVVFVRGPAGIGKSSVVHELQRAMLEKRANFAEGKFDQLHRHVPFSAVSQAIATQVAHILLEPEEQLEDWRRRLAGAMGSVGRAMIDVVPSLRLLVDEPKPVPPLGPRETQNRLLGVACRVLAELCRYEPLVLFIDDLQWADAGTLELLRALTFQAAFGVGLLIVGAYRPEEVAANVALVRFIDDLQKNTALVRGLDIGPLTADALTDLLIDMTGAPREDCTGLAQVVAKKTAGNPFFAHEFIKHLDDRGLLRYERDRKYWTWDLSTIVATDVTENVLVMMSEKIVKLPPRDVELLSTAACLGNKFSLHVLADAYGIPPHDAARHLDGALKIGLILPSGSAYRYAKEADSAADVSYAFAHDRIRETCYKLMPPEIIMVREHQIGHRLLAHVDRNKPRAWIFDVLPHLNAALDLAQTEAAKHELVELNWLGAQQALRAAAFSIARGWLETAVRLLTPNVWDGEFQLAWGLHLALAECHILAGHKEAAHQLIVLLSTHARTDLEKAVIEQRRATAYTAAGQIDVAYRAGVAGLKLLGFSLRGDLFGLIGGVIKLQLAMRKRNWRDLETAPPIDQPAILAALRLLQILTVPSYHTSNIAFIEVTVTLAYIAMRHGGSLYTALVYGALAAADGSSQKFATARQYAAAALRLAEAEKSSHAKGSAYLAANAYGRFLDEEPRQLAENFSRGVTLAQEEGDLLYKHANFLCLVGQLFWFDLNALDALYNAYRGHLAEAVAWSPTGSVDPNVQMTTVMVQLGRCLQGKTSGPDTLSEDGFDEASLSGSDLAEARELFLLAKSIARLIQHPEALTAAGVRTVAAGQFIRQTVPYISIPMSMLMCLVLIGESRGRPTRRDARLIRRLRQSVVTGARASPERYGGQLLLVDAAGMAFRNPGEAAVLFERACCSLEQSSYSFAAAIGYECALRFCLSARLPAAAATYGKKAVDYYGRWGARSKAAALTKELYGYHVLASSGQHQTWSTLDTDRGSNAQIDLVSISEAAHAIASEVQTDKLATQILDKIMRCAGATRASLHLYRDDALVPVADSGPDPGTVPEELVGYVARTMESVVISDTKNRQQFAAVSFERSGAKSVLCAPIVTQRRCKGVIYLENTLIPHAFVESSLVPVQMLAGQAGIALENADMYARLEQLVASKTAALNVAHARVVELERETTEVQMAGGFAHEMRNALAGPRYAMEALLSADENASGEALATVLMHSPEFLGESLALINDGLARSAKITDQILHYAQVGQAPPQLATTSLTAVVDEVLAELGEAFAARKIAVQVDVDAALQVLMNREHAYTVLHNLVGNAYDAVCATASEGEREIRIKTERAAGTLRIVVADSGVGMSEDTQKKLFQPFFSTKGAHGTGLGLGLSRKIVQAYGGKILFESALDHGTSFSVELPAPEVRHK